MKRQMETQATKASTRRTTTMRSRMGVCGLVSAALLVDLLGSAGDARASSHAFINMMRSSQGTQVFVSQSVQGEYGKLSRDNDVPSTDASAPGKVDVNAPARLRKTWQGYGINTTFGLEVMKFIQFRLGHTFVNQKAKSGEFETMHGSRLEVGPALMFNSPLGNLEFGAGLLGSKVDYQRSLNNSSFIGRGNYYSIGLNYFMTSQVSLFFQMKQLEENFVRDGGSPVVRAMQTEFTNVTSGFSLWL